MTLSELDALMDATEMPVRPETLNAAWELTEVRERARRVLILVTMRARPGTEERLERAVREFVTAASGVAGFQKVLLTFVCRRLRIQSLCLWDARR